MKRWPFISCLFLSALLGCQRTSGITADLFSLKFTSSDGSLFDFSSLRNGKASVFVFITPDCPLSQSYTLTLNSLHERFVAQGIAFVGVIPGRGVERGEAEAFVRQYAIRFPVVSDPDLKLVSLFNAVVTPEVFAVDSQQQVFYKGAIDNWAVDLGQHRRVITENYLSDALVGITASSPAKVTQTVAVGCFIERNLNPVSR